MMSHASGSPYQHHSIVSNEAGIPFGGVCTELAGTVGQDVFDLLFCRPDRPVTHSGAVRSQSGAHASHHPIVQCFRILGCCDRDEPARFNVANARFCDGDDVVFRFQFGGVAAHRFFEVGSFGAARPSATC